MPAQPTQSLSIEQWLARAAAGPGAAPPMYLDPRHFYRWPIIDQVAAACHKPLQQWHLCPPIAAAAAPFSLRPEPAARLLRQRCPRKPLTAAHRLPLEDFFFHSAGSPAAKARPAALGLHGRARRDPPGAVCTPGDGPGPRSLRPRPQPSRPWPHAGHITGTLAGKQLPVLRHIYSSTS